MLCNSCGASITTELCPHHTQKSSDDWEWAQNNRAMCDMLHRGIRLKRVPLAERESLTKEVA